MARKQDRNDVVNSTVSAIRIVQLVKRVNHNFEPGPVSKPYTAEDNLISLN